jgi:hypothetical protein
VLPACVWRNPDIERAPAPVTGGLREREIAMSLRTVSRISAMTHDPANPERVLIKEFHVDGPAEASHLFVFAHGAGVGMAAPFMETLARHIAVQGIRVVRFHFPYMEDSVRAGRRRPPDGGRILRAAFADVIRHCIERERCPPARLVIGGKSMGGRIASMIADEHRVAGVVCFGYPFHPPRQPAKLRTKHLAGLRTPMLICQGERDVFGTRAEVAGYTLAPGIQVCWIADGDHDLAPRRAAGPTHETNLAEAAAAAVSFIRALPAAGNAPPARRLPRPE